MPHADREPVSNNGLVPLAPRGGRWSWLRLPGKRELLLAAAALGLVLGVSWVDDQYACAHIDDHGGELERRDQALDSFLAAHCDELACEQLELVAVNGCLAKIRTRARRVDAYGDTLGTFVTVEGLAYSPLLGRWRVRELIDDKQVLGLPVP